MKPKALCPGDTIALVSPASAVDRDKVEAGIRVLNEAGFQVRAMPHAYGRWRYLAGTDAERAQDLQDAFSDPDIDGVMCVRGGYGCSRLVERLDLDLIASSRKLFVGYSDVTILHLALNKRGLPTLHGPMAGFLAQERLEWVVQAWLAALGGEIMHPQHAPPAKTVVRGRAEGLVTGGCLTLVADAIGTTYAMDGQGKIVLLEDVGEEAYRVDARLTHLLNAGAFEGVAGIVVGEMTGTDEKNEEPTATPWRDVVRERLEPLGVPMVFDYPFGHIDAPLSLPLGIRARLDADAGTLTYLEPLCE